MYGIFVCGMGMGTLAGNKTENRTLSLTSCYPSEIVATCIAYFRWCLLLSELIWNAMFFGHIRFGSKYSAAYSAIR